MAEDPELCTCGGTPVIVMACSGGSNVGQLANKAAKGLVDGKSVRMSCLAGIGGHVSTLCETAKAARKIIAIDGCPVACARKTLNHIGLDGFDHVVITDMGIKKNYRLEIDREELERVMESIRGRIDSLVQNNTVVDKEAVSEGG